jgi:hypothetical protein
MPAQTKIQIRRGNAASWTSTNPTLSAGEIGLETDTGKYKIGDGSNTWTALSYYPTLTNANTFTAAQTATSFIVTGSTVPANGIYLPDTNTLGFATNSGVRMRINSVGAVGINTGPSSVATLSVGGTPPVSSNQSYALQIISQFSSTSTNAIRGVYSFISTEAGSYTVATLRHFDVPSATIGEGATVTEQVGFRASLTGATNNYGFQGNAAAGTGRWNFYGSGTAANYFAGQTTVGSTSLTLGSGSVAQQFGVVSTTAARVATVVQGAASQTGDLTQWQNSAGTVLASVTSGGNVGIGTTPTVPLEIATTASPMSIFTAGATSSAFRFRRANTSIASPSVVANGDVLSRLDFLGYDGSSYQSAAAILVAVDGTPGANDMPGRLQFYTVADGSTTITERLRIDSAGNLRTGSMALATSSEKTIHIADGTAPTANPSGGGVLYVESGALKYRGSSGTVTTIANA